MTNFTKEQFRQRYGYDLEKVVPDDHDPSSKVDRAILDVTELIQEYVHSQVTSFDFEDLSDAQESYINKACMEQMIWHITQGDFSRKSGYNASTETYAPASETSKRAIAPNAKRILNNHIICRCF